MTEVIIKVEKHKMVYPRVGTKQEGMQDWQAVQQNATHGNPQLEQFSKRGDVTENNYNNRMKIWQAEGCQRVY